MGGTRLADSERGERREAERGVGASEDVPKGPPHGPPHKDDRSLPYEGRVIQGWHVALILGIAGLVALFYQGLWGNPHDIPTVLVGTPAPGFSGPEVNTGEMISLKEYKGKVVMLNFWASWCLECREEHQNLLAIHKRFGKNPNFVLLGINYQDQEEDAQQYLETYGSSFQHVRDLKGTISIDYGVYGVPETFIVDQQGIIQHKVVGPLIGPVYTQVTEQVIAPLLQRSPKESL